ncbi:MAG TPA: (2Fe-2S)-binding protein [Novosphingobium sp.]|nr:(2Fe-2S)-binding protein [Novosphingobium sp.]
MTDPDTRRRDGVTRPAAITLACDGAPLLAYPGETLAAALMAAGHRRLRDDLSGRPRGMYCNMGTCSECFVWVSDDAQGPWRRRRACMTPAAPGLCLRTSEAAPDAD